MNGISDKKYIIAWMSLGDPIVVISKFNEEQDTILN
jgi:hypothetical protein